MISTKLFGSAEADMIHMANLWNNAENSIASYERLFTSNPHELAAMIQQKTTYSDWQKFLSDSRVQDYVDKVIYTQAGILISKLMREDVKLGVAEATKLNSAIKYRDDHKPNFATPVQYIYIQTPLTVDEEAFLPDVPENNKSTL